MPDLIEQYLAKAQEAEEHAGRAPDVMKNTWLRIAQSYRDLARFAGNKTIQPRLPR